MTILQACLRIQIDPTDALVLDKYYGNIPDDKFLEGAEKVVNAILDDLPQDFNQPAVEPWSSIFAFLLVDDAPEIKVRFEHSLLAYSEDDRRTAITNLVNVYLQQQIQWRNSQAKINGNGKKMMPDQIVRSLAKFGYKFRLNLCDDHVEVNGAPLTDTMMSQIRTKCVGIGITNSRVLEDAYITEAAAHAYHPVKEYLYGCAYDGTTDYIAELASYFTDEYGMFDIWLRKWMVGAVAKVIGHHQNRMLILDGPQDLGKSYFVNWLAGGIREYFYEGAIDTYNRKDTEVLLMNTWIWEVSELGGTFARAELNALKAFLTQQNVKVRKAYGRTETMKPAMASFIGTVNNEAGILNDYTGSRRYFISKLSKIDKGYTKIRVDDVWGQAMFLYQSGEKWSLDDSERAASNEINETYTIEDPTQAAIFKYFEVDFSQQNWFMSTLDIAQIIEEKGLHFGSSSATMMAVGRALVALGATRGRLSATRGKREFGYRGIKPKSYGFP